MNEIILGLLGGLALFLYGMQMMSNGLEAAAGNRMKEILEKLTANRFLGVLVGAVVTAVIQSSSATTVMVVGFVNAGMMTLSQAVWIIMGANIGTTITGQLIALDVGAMAPLLAFLGVAAVVFLKNPKIKHIGEIVAGLGVLFIGMDMMSAAMMPLRESEMFISLMTKFSNPVLGILAGMVFTAIIQSSSASVGILQALASNGLIAFPNAVFVLFGQNKNAGVAGVWVFVFLERILIPFGLHHLLYSPFWYDNAIVSGGLYTYWATKLPEIAASTASLKSLVPEAGICATGFSKIFGCTGIALAFYATAKPEKRKKVLGLLVPITLTAIFCGVTEPIEFTFLFMAPVLFVVHAVLAACLSTCMYLAGIVGIHAGGVIEMASLNWIPLMGNHWKQYLVMLLIGLFFVAIYFVVFRFLILKFDFKTPGREDDEEIKFNSKAEFREKQASKGKKGSYEELILEGLGGKDNIVDVTNCATRLRVNVKDETLCQNEAYFKSIGAHGCWHLYQPRVEPMWSEAVFKRNEYAPFVEAKRKALEELEGDNKTIHLENHMYMHDSMYCIYYCINIIKHF